MGLRTTVYDRQAAAACTYARGFGSEYRHVATDRNRAAGADRIYAAAIIAGCGDVPIDLDGASVAGQRTKRTISRACDIARYLHAAAVPLTPQSEFYSEEFSSCTSFMHWARVLTPSLL